MEIDDSFSDIEDYDEIDFSVFDEGYGDSGILTVDDPEMLVDDIPVELQTIPNVGEIEENVKASEENLHAMEVPHDEVNIKNRTFSCALCGKKYSKDFLLVSHARNCFNPLDESSVNEEFVKNSGDILIQTLREAMEYPFFNMRPPGTEAAQLAGLIIAQKDDEFNTIFNFSSTLHKTLLSILNTEKADTKTISAMLSKFYILTVSDELVELFKKLLFALGIATDHDGFSLLIQFLVDNSFKELLKLHNNLISSNEGVDLNLLKLSEDEEETLRYVAGYIPFSIKKYLMQQKKSEANTLLTSVIDSWNKATLETQDNSILGYSKKWVDKVNRGGLFIVCDNFYRFIVRVEITARKVLNTRLIHTYCGEDLRKVITEKLEADPFVNFGWNSLVRNINNKNLCEQLKKMIFKKWISVRAHSFVKAWVDIVKFKSIKGNLKTKTLDRKAEPGFRKTLAR